MRHVPAEMTQNWKDQAKTGAQRPVVRATIQVQNLKRFEYDTAWANGGTFDTDRHRTGIFTSMIFGDLSGVREIRNIKSYNWKRSVDQDVATCEITFLNAEMTAIGNPAYQSPTETDFEQPGYYTFNRGQQNISANRWGYDDDTGWQGLFVPDRLVRTYEGYGTDSSVSPALDPNLIQSGVWLIDKVDYGTDGTVTLTMRDLGRMLLDQICFPPVIPYAEYPLQWSRFRSENVPARDVTGGHWVTDMRPLGDATSSNTVYIGEGLVDPPFSAYVTSNGGWNGHHPRHALTADYNEWWTSTGQTTRDSFVWWEFDCNDPIPLAALRLSLKGGPCRVYISVHNGTNWIGKRKIPYEVTTEDIPIGAKIPYMKSVIADRGFPFDVILPRVVNSATKIRITFTRLVNGIGNYPWRASLRHIHAYTADDAGDLGFTQGEVLKVVGNYGDYTAIVKWICAWGGFFWPPHGTGLDFQRINLGVDATTGQEKIFYTYPVADGSLPKGRVWGDFMPAGTAGVADLTIDLFDKKPLMDVINYVRDLLGFLFFIDETGGVVWRMPNIWSLGNYVSPGQLQLRPWSSRVRTTDIITLDEEDTLLDYSTTLDSSNIRERIFVANTVGKVGTLIKGFNPYPVGLRRLAGWTDQNFATKQETRVMADMISARQMFTYRRGHATIPGYPAIQIDDQIRIFERLTNETYYHYVLGIESSLDMDSGEWYYKLETHWLGERPSDAWVVHVDELAQGTQQYLNAIGYAVAD